MKQVERQDLPGTVHKFGRIVQATQLRSRMRLFRRYALVFCVDGEAEYKDANGVTADIQPGSMILVFPDLMHKYHAKPGRSWSEIFLVFEGPIFDLWKNTGLLDPANPVLRLDSPRYWERRIESVKLDDRPSDVQATIQEICRLQQLLVDALFWKQTQEAKPQTNPWIRDACDLLSKGRSVKISIPQVARELGLPYDYFRKEFTRQIGQSPSRFRNSKIVEEACRLMRDTPMTNKEIAHQLGYSDEFHFSHRFKTLTGRWPSELRRQGS